MNLKIDIHNHLLPGVDDGFKSKEDSIAAIKMMVEGGCSEITFTPHLNPEIYSNTEESVRSVYGSFVAEIPAELNIKTHLAAEYMVVKDFEERVGEDLLYYPDGSLLIEMSYYYRSENLEKTVFELGMAGHTPIIAHPERYLYMAGCLDDFSRLKDMGCKFQLNALSLTGCYGRDSVRIMDYLFKNKFYDYISTDLHSIDQLKIILGISPRKKYRDEVEKWFY